MRKQSIRFDLKDIWQILNCPQHHHKNYTIYNMHVHLNFRLHSLWARCKTDTIDLPEKKIYVNFIILFRFQPSKLIFLLTRGHITELRLQGILTDRIPSFDVDRILDWLFIFLILLVQAQIQFMETSVTIFLGHVCLVLLVLALGHQHFFHR